MTKTKKIEGQREADNTPELIAQKSQEFHDLIDSGGYDDRPITYDDVDHFAHQAVDFAIECTQIGDNADGKGFVGDVVEQARIRYQTSQLRDATEKEALKIAADKALMTAFSLANIIKNRTV